MMKQYSLEELQEMSIKNLKEIAIVLNDNYLRSSECIRKLKSFKEENKSCLAYLIVEKYKFINRLLLCKTLRQTYEAEEMTEKVLKLLSLGCGDVNLTDEYGYTPLIYASKMGYIKVVCALIENGSLIDKTGHNGENPLNVASYHNHIDIVCLLLEKGALPIPNCYNFNPLHSAVLAGNTDIIEILVKSGYDIEKISGYETPLSVALVYGQYASVLKLIELGAFISSCHIFTSFAKKENLDAIKLFNDNVENLDSLDTESLDNLFNDNHTVWRRIAAKRFSRRVFMYYCGKYADMLNVSVDVVCLVFENDVRI